MPKISALNLLNNPAPADYVPIVDADANATKRVLLSALGVGPYSEANVSNPPTNEELIGVFGAAALSGPGFVAVLNDAGGGSNEYIIVSDGTKYLYVALTSAP